MEATQCGCGATDAEPWHSSDCPEIIRVPLSEREHDNMCEWCHEYPKGEFVPSLTRFCSDECLADYQHDIWENDEFDRGAERDGR